MRTNKDNLLNHIKEKKWTETDLGNHVITIKLLNILRSYNVQGPMSFTFHNDL